jgi:thiamine biosynthesis lipoprotein
VKKSFNRSIFNVGAIAVIFSLFFLSGCSPKKKTYRFFALDTIIDITLYSNSTRADAAIDSLERLVLGLDTLLSISRTEGEVYRINHRKDSVVTVTGALREILSYCRREWKLSNGLFDVTVEPLKYLYGLESHQEKHHVPSAAELACARDRIGFGKITFIGDSAMVLPPGMHIDFGGIAKGYILDRTRAFLASGGYGSFMINLGGDLIASGTKPSGKPWLIGIRDPRDDQGLSARLTVSNTALFTSGDYERFFIENGRRYHHIFNPKTGLPGTCNRSATAVGTDILAVDAAVKTAFLIPAACGGFSSTAPASPGLRPG